MNKVLTSLVVLTSLLFGSQAYAHVGYRSLDVNNPFTDSVTSDFGWYEGTTPTLANSHDLRWFSFTVTEAGNYDINVEALGAGVFNSSSRTVPGGVNANSFTSVGALDVAFSLFRGLVPPSSVESITRTGTNPDGTPILGGFAVTGQGITTDGIQHSPSSLFAGDNTLTNTAGLTGTITFMTAVNEKGVGITESLTNYFFKAGSYSLLVGGASQKLIDPEDGITILNDGFYGITASLTPTTLNAVPVPAAVWMFGSAMVGLVGFGRRKQLAV